MDPYVSEDGGGEGGAFDPFNNPDAGGGASDPFNNPDGGGDGGGSFDPFNNPDGGGDGGGGGPDPFNAPSDEPTDDGLGIPQARGESPPADPFNEAANYSDDGLGPVNNTQEPEIMGYIGDYSYDEDGLGKFSLGKVFKGIAKSAVKAIPIVGGVAASVASGGGKGKAPKAAAAVPVQAVQVRPVPSNRSQSSTPPWLIPAGLGLVAIAILKK
jgi:hypothetical protein